jgi:ubiquinone/menaquinone biosynthesis C-methylase UbiE
MATFGAAMRSIGSHVAEKVVANLELDSVATMLDVGGGFGHYAQKCCEVNDQLHATVLDVPEVAEMAGDQLAGTGFEHRIRFIGGDYLTSEYGSGFDLVLICNVLHQENAADAAEMIRRGAAALAPGGRVAVVDFLIDDAQRERVLGALFAINMRSIGDSHTEPSIRSWLEAAGLSDIRRTDIDQNRWLITGHKPG